MDRKSLMDAVVKTAFDLRIEPSALCTIAGVSPTVFYRYKRKGTPPTLPTIGKLEKALEGLRQ
jgi:hypothetical protein